MTSNLRGRIAWSVMTFFAFGICAYAMVLVAVPRAGEPFLRERFASIPLPTYAHLFLGGIALAVGSLQFSTTLRTRRLAIHRALGKVYVIAVFSSALAALILATFSQGGMAAHFGFGVLAVLWFVTTAVAYRKIRRGDVARHREWMIRSYALTLAAVTLRIYIPLSMLAGIRFAIAYPAISWLCWVPNLIVAEWIIRPQSTETRSIAMSSPKTAIE